MSPKQKRDRLFGKSRPVIRRLEILDGENYSKDMSVLWAAYKAGSFPMPEGLTQEQFVTEIENGVSGFSQAWIVDDKNKNFSSGRGQIALVGTTAAGMIIELKLMFFKWATKRNILRGSAAFINMLRHSKKTGIVLVRTQKDKMNLPDHLKGYDLLFYLGQSGENEYLYSARGRGN